jgi:hypothetical protein
MSTTYHKLDSNITNIILTHVGESNGESIVHIRIEGLACTVDATIPDDKRFDFLAMWIEMDSYVTRYASGNGRMALQYSLHAQMTRNALPESWFIDEFGYPHQYGFILLSVQENRVNLA